MTKAKYKRILLKISGEALQGRHSYGIDPDVINKIAAEIKDVSAHGIQIAIVIGGGNIFRGLRASVSSGMDRAMADYIGMLATVMNGLAMQDALERAGVSTRVMTAIDMRQLAEPYIRRRAIRHLEKGRAVIFVAGTGNPYFTTDTTAALRATEIHADVILKATKVDGIYAKDPKIYKVKKMYRKLKYIDVLKRGIKVMDSTAITLCMDNKMPIIVFSLNSKGNILRVVTKGDLGTLVSD